MGRTRPDDWEKPRGPGIKLTASEVNRIRIAFEGGRLSRDIARELQCSTRVANKYYGMFRGYTRQRHEKPKIAPRPAPVHKCDRESRFYKSNFEL